VTAEQGSTARGCGAAAADQHMAHTEIVIVDGDDANRATLCRALTGAGLSHVCVRSGVEALAQLTTSPFKVALLDVSLSDTDGGVALRRRMSEMQPPGIIVMIGVNTPDRVLGALKTHAYDVVPTPIEADLLQEVIHRALAADAAIPPVEVLCADRTWVELLVPCVPEAAERIQRFINQLESDLDVDARESVGLALRDLLLRAVGSGEQMDSPQRVRVLRRRARGVVVYRTTYPGPVHRLHDLPHAAGAQDGEAAIVRRHVRDRDGTRASGLGLMRVRAIADELVYNPQGNEVTFVKYLAEPSGHAPNAVSTKRAPSAAATSGRLRRIPTRPNARPEAVCERPLQES
jgi:CheY-like chemotaxis protein